MDAIYLKKMLRELKKQEGRIRFRDGKPAYGERLLWDSFFSAREDTRSPVRYPFQALQKLDRVELQGVLDEYFEAMGELLCGVHRLDPAKLHVLGLPGDSNIQMVKSRFRELAKLHHPDYGGNAEQFQEIFEAYSRLLNRH